MCMCVFMYVCMYVCGGRAWVMRRNAASSARVKVRQVYVCVCMYVCMYVCV